MDIELPPTAVDSHVDIFALEIFAAAISAADMTRLWIFKL
jgi:hypothetical protein